MRTINILEDTAFQQRRVELDGLNYQLELTWNGRAGLWFISLATLDGTPLVCGLALVCNRLLLTRFRYIEGLPAGDFMAADLTETVAAPGYAELGTTIPLVYFEAEDLA